MIDRRMKLAIVALCVLFGAFGAFGPQALAAAPVKQIEAHYFGWEVNKQTKGEICSVSEECQPGKRSSEAGAFSNPRGIAAAVPPSDDIFVADEDNSRIQELEADGDFVLMFGSKVNKGGGNLCTAAERSQCQAGLGGKAPGQLDEPKSIAVNPSNGDLYVAEAGRVQELTPTGEFVLEIGHEVNETRDAEAGATGAQRNLCTEQEVKASGVKCGPPRPASSEEPGSFTFHGFEGNILAIGGPEYILYVGGQEGRVQEFETQGSSDGKSKGEVGVPGIVSRIAAGPSGDVYIGAKQSVVTPVTEILVFSHEGLQVGDLHLEGDASVGGLAVDSSGRLAVSEDLSVEKNPAERGTLYEVIEGLGVPALHVITRFPGHGMTSLAFNANDELFGALAGVTNVEPLAQEVIGFVPVPVGELVTSGISCAPGGSIGSDVTVECHLEGSVDPFGVSETEAWFQWGTTAALGHETPKQSIATGSVPVGVGANIQGLRPAEAYSYRVAGYDHYVKAPELLSSETGSFTTSIVAPVIQGEPSSSFVSSSSVDMLGELNPENAPTRYEFQYGVCESLEACPTKAQTQPGESSVYALIDVGAEVKGLQPATVYRYRLVADSENPAKTEKKASAGPEGTFTTLPAPVPTASTGPANAITPTTAVISGTVDPDGLPASYIFELGIYNGSETRYGVVFSASAGSAVAEHSLQLSGLQPGTTYAFRIAVRSGYINSESHTVLGAPELFTTEGLPASLLSPSSLAMLTVPKIAFPKPATQHKPPKKHRARSKKKKPKGRKSSRRSTHRRGVRR
jgi:hypothetical protein